MSFISCKEKRIPAESSHPPTHSRTRQAIPRVRRLRGNAALTVPMAGLGPRDTQDGRILHSHYSVDDDWDGPVLVIHRVQGVGEGVSPRGVIPTPVEYASYIYKYKLTKFTIDAARVEPANRLRYQSSEVRDGLNSHTTGNR